MDGTSLKNNLDQVRQTVESACQKSGRSSENISLVTVTKRKPAAIIRKAWTEAGLNHFGENYVQEALEKQNELKDIPCVWHFIGSLQSNKVKAVVGRFEWIHSIDRWSLIKEISKKASELQVIQKILIQVNLESERSKGGLEIDQGPPLIEKIQECSNVRLCGLMAMPPLYEDSALRHKVFSKLRKLSEDWTKYCSPEKGHHLTELSMGTSFDYKEAVEEGATMIRLGRVLLGERDIYTQKESGK